MPNEEGRKLVNFRMDAALHRRMKTQAAKEGRALQEIFIEFAEAYLEGTEKVEPEAPLGKSRKRA